MRSSRQFPASKLSRCHGALLRWPTTTNGSSGSKASPGPQISGVVPHVKQWGLDSDDTQSLRAQLYFPFMQLPDRAMATSASGLGVVLRSTGNVSGLLNSIQRANREMSSHQVIYSVQTMN